MTAIDENGIENKADLFKRLGKITSRKWNVKLVAIVTLRTQLLKAQKYKCVYCRRKIALDEVGHRDIDHILPKSRNPLKDDEFDVAVAKNNDYDHRRHTRGYPEFMYSPKNLALSCKICNSTKGSFDPLLDRAQRVTSLPSGANAYHWIHPYYDRYDQHITIKEGFVYEAITADRGQYVISACGLDTLAGLTDRILEAMTLESKDLSDAMLEIALDNAPLDIRRAAEHLHKLYEKLTVDLMEKFLRKLKEATSLTEKISTLTDLRNKLGSGDAVPAAR
ncbi:HNH endonuclease domain-containing protein [Herbaspirillum sp.]|uniref:HNH endonuclease n=1 Tax=Herbaspirillum sp. TaxID=1890675 RepID=UPI0031D65FC7